MKVFLERNKLFVRDEEDRFYKTMSVELYDGKRVVYINLQLVGGMRDGILLPPSEFDANYHYIQEFQYFFEEGMRECLEANDYTILDDEDIDNVEGLRYLIDAENYYC